MDGKRWFFFLGLILFTVTGCASNDDSGVRSLCRQQSATIASLNDEILRLNREMDGTASLRGDLQTAEPKIAKMLAGEILRGDVRVVLDSRGLTVTILDHALFDPDETQFTSSGEEILGKIAAVLSSDLSTNRVTLEGHTDDQPVENADGVTNWEYSIGRAAAVLHFFLDAKGLPPERFGVAGYAEYRPADTNATEEGRDRNRRIEIIIVPEGSPDAPVRS